MNRSSKPISNLLDVKFIESKTNFTKVVEKIYIFVTGLAVDSVNPKLDYGSWAK